MALYRVLQNLKIKNGVILKGDFITGASYSPDSLTKLEEVGAIGLLHAPPLSALPGFEMVAARLEEINISDADQLLECDSATLAQQLSTDAATVRRWQMDVSDWLVIPARVESG